MAYRAVVKSCAHLIEAGVAAPARRRRVAPREGQSPGAPLSHGTTVNPPRAKPARQPTARQPADIPPVTGGARGWRPAPTARVVSRPADDSALTEFFGQILRTTSGLLEAGRVSLWFCGERNHSPVLYLCYADGRLFTRPDAVGPGARPTRGRREETIWRVIRRTRKPVLVHAPVSERTAPSFKHARVGRAPTVLAVPLVDLEKVIGMITIHHTRRGKDVARAIKTAQALTEQATMAVQLSRMASQRQWTAVLEERGRIARELHDTLAQGFTGIMLRLEVARDALLNRRASEADEHLRQAGQLARHSLNEARRAVRALRPQFLEEGSLPSALERLMRQMTPGNAPLGYQWR
jgi:GAF domain-containing protein